MCALVRGRVSSSLRLKQSSKQEKCRVVGISWSPQTLSKLTGLMSMKNGILKRNYWLFVTVDPTKA